MPRPRFCSARLPHEEEISVVRITGRSTERKSQTAAIGRGGYTRHLSGCGFARKSTRVGGTKGSL